MGAFEAIFTYFSEFRIIKTLINSWGKLIRILDEGFEY